MDLTTGTAGGHRRTRRSLLLVGIVVGVVAAGCGSDTDSDTAAPATTAAAAPTTSPELDAPGDTTTTSTTTEAPPEPTTTPTTSENTGTTETATPSTAVIAESSTDVSAGDTSETSECVALERLHVAYVVAQGEGSAASDTSVAASRSEYLLSAARDAVEINTNPALDLESVLEFAERLDPLLAANGYDLASVPESAELEAVKNLALVAGATMNDLGAPIRELCSTSADQLAATAKTVRDLIEDGGDPFSVPMPSAA